MSRKLGGKKEELTLVVSETIHSHFLSFGKGSRSQMMWERREIPRWEQKAVKRGDERQVFENKTEKQQHKGRSLVAAHIGFLIALPLLLCCGLSFLSNLRLALSLAGWQKSLSSPSLSKLRPGRGPELTLKLNIGPGRFQTKEQQWLLLQTTSLIY